MIEEREWIDNCGMKSPVNISYMFDIHGLEWIYSLNNRNTLWFAVVTW